MGGAARFQRENILAAIATAYVQGMRYDDIRAGLLSFFPSPSLDAGPAQPDPRGGGGRVLVDYAHNAAAIAGLMEFVAALDGGAAHRRAHRARATAATRTSAQRGPAVRAGSTA